jgi:hypothetical protein
MVDRSAIDTVLVWPIGGLLERFERSEARSGRTAIFFSLGVYGIQARPFTLVIL